MIAKKYLMTLDETVVKMAKRDVDTKGIDKYVEDELKRLDCSRVVDGMRLMQTIGVPYQYEATRLLTGIHYALESGIITENKADEYKSKLGSLHKRNLKYEEDNPPIIYDKKKKVKNTRTPRKKAVQGTLKGFEKPEKEPTAKQINAQVRANLLANLKIGIK